MDNIDGKTNAGSPRGPAQHAQAVDVLVVGGGSAGAVLAARLSERPDRSVLLLEAGTAHAAWNYPAHVSSSDRLGGDETHEWGYKAEPGVIGHAVGALRGKGLGGSSAINGAVAIRARESDFANWGLPGWSYADLLPAFKRLEDNEAGKTDLHGEGGPLPVRQLTAEDITPMQRAFVDAARKLGYAAVHDFDGPDPHGVGPYRMNVVNGVRVNTGMAYLGHRVRARANLRVQGQSLVDHVLFSAGKAVGVRLADGQTVHANEVILCAGTYGSAAILLRSGVGPRRDLDALEIPVLADLPVGVRLKDHPFYYNAYAANPEAIGAQSPVIGAKLWTRSSMAGADELDLHITATHLFPHELSPTKVGFVLAVALTLPRSTGKLSLTSRDPASAPRIDLNFLADAGDRARLMEGVKLARKLGQTTPLDALVHAELAPGPAARDDHAIERSMLESLDTYHHPTSTVPMGGDDDPYAVLDLQCRVRGLKGLRVVDASIFPDTVSVATNVTTIAVAEHVADRFYSTGNNIK
ncbi:GMC family oxidoreductase N-terminal domain-containing protein [Burkholderia arboris]|uniref:GMC family oxidoreductase N-terminal domain-containing protein n=1 Tax=Burkholderia arboris TaxID=488730 RepID=A0ABZ3DT01_9BURK